MAYKKAEPGRGRDVKKGSKSYIPDIGVHRPTEMERNLGPILAEGGSYPPKRDSERKRPARESYEDEEMDLDYGEKEKQNEQNQSNNPPFVPLLSLGKIGEK